MNEFTFNSKGHYYELNGKRMHGVTTVLGVIAKPALVGWAAKMTAEWIRKNCVNAGDEYIVKELELQEAVKAHTKKKEAGGTKGTDVHSLVEGYIKNCIEHNQGNALSDIGYDDGMLLRFINWSRTNKIKFLESEKKMYSKEWWVAGTCDFTFIKDGKRYVGDLKTMKKVWDRTPFFQVAAYRKMLEEMGDEPYDGTCIVNINKETNELTEHWSYRTEADQDCFEAALALYKNLELI